MRAPDGQAARGRVSMMVLAGRCLLALALLLAIGVGALAWRLASGPIALPWLATWISVAASASDRTVIIEQLLLSRGGFLSSGSSPLQVRLIGVTASGSFGTASLAQGDVALPLFPLLGLHVAPDSADLTGLRLHLKAAPKSGGDASPSVTDVLHRLASPLPDGPWARLRHLHVHDVSAEMAGFPGQVTRLDIDLDRPDGGGLTGKGQALLQSGAQQATLTLAAQLAPDGRGTAIQARLTPISPAALAGTAPEAAPLAALAALDAPVTLSGTATLGPALDLIRAEASVAMGGGTIHAGQGTAPLLGADLLLLATPAGIDLQLVRLDTAASATSPPTRFSGHALATPAASGGYQVTAGLDVDQVAFADLPALWPEGVGGAGARSWMTENLTAGRLTAGHVEADLIVPVDFSDVTLGRIAGGIDGHDVTAHWLRPVPPLEHGEAKLTVSDPDVIDITVASATQAGGSFGGMQFRDATIRLTGIAAREQYADIRTGLAGPLPDLLAVLNNPRIQLLSKRPLPMRDPGGDVTAQVHVEHLPLRADVKMDDLVIEAKAQIAHTHLGGIVAGRDLTDGALDLTANNDGLTVDGTAALAGFASTLKIGMDFRAGPPDQVQENVAARSTVDMAHLAALGLDVGKQVGGSAQVDTTLTGRRDGRTEIAVAADLAAMTVSEPRLGMSKRADEPGSASVRIVLDHDKLVGIEALRVEAPGLSVLGQANMKAGKPVGFHFDRVVLGTGTDLTGGVRITGAERKIEVRLSGPSLDISPLFGASDKPKSAPKNDSESMGLSGQAWSGEVAVDRLILGPGRRLEGVRAVADSDGTVLRSASIDARLPGGDGAKAQARITPDAGGRRLTVDIGDAGALLHAADVTDALIGGKLRVTARWSSLTGNAPLAGVAEMTDFRLRDAPAIGRVLKALTIYGLMDLARGPGLGFTRLLAPFGLDERVLTLREARAFSSSLGFTAHGRIDLGRRTADLNGTVVPAYFFNSLLGHVPWVGRLFTAETGGGLFAASVAITGPLDDLSTSVNPLSALTPGLLRGLFGTDNSAR